jgi:hypothetical protein
MGLKIIIVCDYRIQRNKTVPRKITVEENDKRISGKFE